MNERKYELLTNDTINYLGRTLYRIKSLKDFDNVKKGDIGGYIEKESNLSHKGNCWVYNNARVYGNARVCDNARVCCNAKVYDNAEVCGNVEVYGNAIVCDNAKIYNNAKVYDNAAVYGNAEVYDNAIVYGYTRVHGDAYISSNNDYAVVQGFGSANRSTTFFKCKDNHIHVICGCFSGTLEEFESKVKETHGDNKYGREYLKIIELIKMHFDLE